MSGVRAPLHAFRYSKDALEEWEPEDFAEVRAKAQPGHVVWANVNGTVHEDVLRALAADFGVHPLTVEDIQHTHQRPKVEEYGSYVYVVTRMIKTDEEGELDTEQVSILLGDGWVVTIQEGKPGDVFDGVRTRLRQARPTIRGSGCDYLVYALLDAVVDSYFPILEAFGNRAEELEEEILDGETRHMRDRLQRMRRDLLTLRRVAWPQRDGIAHLSRSEQEWIAPATHTFLRDVSDHINRVIDFVETSRELVANLMDLHLANVAQRTNETMKVLTVVATIFIPLTFIAGVYGMNFAYMPELDYRYGYPLVLGFMFLVAVALLLAFRRRGWV